MFETLNTHDGDNRFKEANALPSESLEANRIGECIARRSLAWDTAFFMSAGMLIYESYINFPSYSFPELILNFHLSFFHFFHA